MKAGIRRGLAYTTLAAIALAMPIVAGCAGAQTAQTTAPTSQSMEVTPAVEQADDEQHAEAAATAGIQMPHIHGLGFSPDGSELIVPAHDGLRIYTDGRWLIPDAPAHDYMGFAPSDNGFYSSGHPDPSSGLVNPFGLVKSTDGGNTLANLGFAGESDFHFMAVGYQNHAIYVGNSKSSSVLQPGIHYSLDDGKTWQQSALQGVTAQPIQLAVHPVDANVVALATEGGLLLSADHGDSFTGAGDGGTVTAVVFNPNGRNLFFGYQQLSAYDLASQQFTALPSPTIDRDDAISYIAVNPVQPDVIALATFSRDMYLSEDGGKTWTLIAEDGKAQ